MLPPPWVSKPDGSVGVLLTQHHSVEVFQEEVLGFSYLSILGPRGRLIWEKQLANIQNWENWTGETKRSILFLNHSKAWKTTP